MGGQQQKAQVRRERPRQVPLPVLIVWCVLVVLTVANPILGSEAAAGDVSASGITAVVILAIAVVKVRFVGLDFMELRHAPRVMRTAFEAYCLVLWTVLTVLFLWL